MSLSKVGPMEHTRKDFSGRWLRMLTVFSREPAMRLFFATTPREKASIRKSCASSQKPLRRRKASACSDRV